ncbi:OmpA family protein [Photobacterium sp.]|uniref:OmpA family protein n=1 Tax=Photobacterium sp. TaxID=660 RepID=UPI00299F0B00|nr:OmpA family protein [Photobacterium sp.]MDX1304596.1 OmpA family protein [Photobacterium sp.]
MAKIQIGILMLVSILLVGCQSTGSDTARERAIKNDIETFVSYNFKQARKLIPPTIGTVKREGDQVTIVFNGDKSFDNNSAYIRSDSHDSLEKLSSLLADSPKSKVFIAGYTDSVGSKVYNRELSAKRAESVLKFFVLRGVDPERINTYGFGELSPIASNKLASGRKQNRRIDVRITPWVEKFE